MSKLTEAERKALKNAFIVAALPQLLTLGVSASQISDIADRALATGNVYMSSSGTTEGYTPSMIIGDLKEDPSARHLFTVADEDAPRTSHNDLGIPQADLEKMSPIKRIELANRQNFIDDERRRKAKGVE